MKTSLKDIAETLKLSKTTISWVLSGKGDEKGISLATQEKVFQCAKQLNYQPNLLARSLNTGISGTIGLIIPDITDSFYSKVARSIEKEAETQGYSLMICSSESEIERENRMIRLFKAKQVDGIYRRAKKEGLRLKAHVGEWGTAKDVRTAVEELELDEVQHGIAAVSDESVIRFLADNKIRLNITPTSNILLGRVADMSMHPIGKLYRSGVDVTINSDDVLIFDSDVSKEYLRLYESQCLTAEELENMRKNGLKPIIV